MTDRKLDKLPHEPSGNPLERTPQVDPILQDGRASPWRIWSLGVGVAVVLAVVIYGIGVQHATKDASAPQSSPGAVTTQGQGGAQTKE